MVVTGRDQARGERAVRALRGDTGNDKIVFRPLDLVSLESVTTWARRHSATGKPLHILVLNAGVMAPPLTRTVEGFESQFGITTGQSLERANETQVQSRRGLSPEAVLDDYVQVSGTGLERLAGLAGLDMPVPLADAGTYPAAVLPAAYAFDHYTHIRADLFPPRGPLDGEPPPSDELLTGSALDWIEAALPQHNAQAAAQATLEIQVTGVAEARALKVV